MWRIDFLFAIRNKADRVQKINKSILLYVYNWIQKVKKHPWYNFTGSHITQGTVTGIKQTRLSPDLHIIVQYCWHKTFSKSRAAIWRLNVIRCIICQHFVVMHWVIVTLLNQLHYHSELQEEILAFCCLEMYKSVPNRRVRIFQRAAGKSLSAGRLKLMSDIYSRSAQNSTTSFNLLRLGITVLSQELLC